MSIAAHVHGGFVVTLNPDDNFVGPVVVYRIQGNGLLDDAFGNDGSVTLPFEQDRYGSTFVDAAGRIWIAGAQRALRLLPDGRLDTTFVPATLPVTPATRILLSRIAAESRGRVFAVGDESTFTTLGEPQAQAVVVAFRSDSGQLDTTFGNGGIVRVVTDRPGEDSFAAALAIDVDDRIVVAGAAGHYSYMNFSLVFTRAWVARYHAGGAPDATFAPGGFVSFWRDYGSGAHAVALLADGRIVVGGLAEDKPGRSGKYVARNPRAALYVLNGGEADRARVAVEATAIEFLHTPSGHYFVTAEPGEAYSLDFDADWSRTGHAFSVWPRALAGAQPVCRFWSGQRFFPLSSHFYTPVASECAHLREQAFWTFEGEVFRIAGTVRDAQGRVGCEAGTQPLYRLYNDGASGAPNHRFVVDASLVDEMLARGWILEGDAQTRVFACVPLQL